MQRYIKVLSVGRGLIECKFQSPISSRPTQGTSSRANAPHPHVARNTIISLKSSSLNFHLLITLKKNKPLEKSQTL